MDVGLSVGVAVVWAWSGLLFLMKSGRGDHNVGLLGSMGGKMGRCSLCGSVLQDQGPGRESGKMVADRRWKLNRSVPR